MALDFRERINLNQKIQGWLYGQLNLKKSIRRYDDGVDQLIVGYYIESFLHNNEIILGGYGGQGGRGGSGGSGGYEDGYGNRLILI